MQIRKLFTWPGDLGLSFLMWRDRLLNHNPILDIVYYLLVPFIVPAILAVMIADLIDDTCDYVFPKKDI